MTPKRKEALQWFHDRGEVKWIDWWRQRKDGAAPTAHMVNRLEKDGMLSSEMALGYVFTLTDEGRRKLHEATK